MEDEKGRQRIPRTGLATQDLHQGCRCMTGLASEFLGADQRGGDGLGAGRVVRRRRWHRRLDIPTASGK